MEQAIVRIVRMEFQADKLEAFHQIFEASKHSIRAREGCLGLELHRDAQKAHVLYTYSIWTSEAALNAYRESELFGKVWPKTKALFAAKPQAFSLCRMEEVPGLGFGVSSLSPETQNSKPKTPPL